MHGRSSRHRVPSTHIVGHVSNPVPAIQIVRRRRQISSLRRRSMIARKRQRHSSSRADDFDRESGSIVGFCQRIRNLIPIRDPLSGYSRNFIAWL